MAARIRIKVCGITTMRDAMVAAELGVDALGFVRAASPRQVSLATAKRVIRELPPFVARVGVFVDSPIDGILREVDYAGFDTVQLHGRESAQTVKACVEHGLTVIKAFRVRGDCLFTELEPYGKCQIAAYLLDAYVPGRPGGSGQVCDWSLARTVARQQRTILAGGLHADNVGDAIHAVDPWAVDASSGLEKSPGQKCAKAMARFVQQVDWASQERMKTHA